MRLVIPTLALVSLLVIILAPFVGPDFFHGAESHVKDAIIFWEIRVPRVVVAFLCGSGLSLGGVVYQAMFRNALATPYTLGVASGANFAVALWVNYGVSSLLWGVSGLSIAALGGACLSVGVVYLLAKVAGGFKPITMLLGGVVLSFFFASLTMLVQHYADAGSSFRLSRWLMGSLGGVHTGDVIQLFPFLLSGSFLVWNYRKELDFMVLGDELAMSRGVEVEGVRKALFIAVSLMVAGVVSVCGPIGFVGIMVPHICRRIVGVGHRDLYWASLLGGGIFLVVCDTLARSCFGGSELPVGVVTALLGAPFFLRLLVGRPKTLNV